MHEEICDVVSHFQYDRFLTTAVDVANRAYALPTVLSDQRRAIWYVMDEDTEDLPSIRAERGPGIGAGYDLQPSGF